MMSTLQARAEKLAAEFRTGRRPAIVVEFAGVPKAGKTSTLNHVYAFLRRCGFKCEVVVERASLCPIRDKKHFNFNVWTACTSLSQLLERTQNPPSPDDPEILFLDRGIFDAICWLSLLERLGRITPQDRQRTADFLMIDDWVSRVSGVVAMSTSPEDALQREQGHLPVQGRGGSIMNRTVLHQMGTVLKQKTADFKHRFRTLSVDTSSSTYSNNPAKTCEDVVTKILDWVAESVEENILSAPRAAFPVLKSKYVTRSVEARNLIEKFESEGDFQPRKQVEGDPGRIQPLPIVVVRNQSGDILRLVRKERESSNRLHKKVVIWAGGHVRRDDGPQKSGSIIGGAIRELQEELRIYSEPDGLNLLGAVYLPSEGSTRKHVAFVYEWRAQTDDVEVALCNSEFMEKSGSSLQGVFLSAEKIYEEAEDIEDWSVEILSTFFMLGSPPRNGARPLA